MMITTGITALIKIKRLTESAKLPDRGSHRAAGLDIFADEDVSIRPGETKRISTGIAIELPPGTVGLFLDRGSIGSKGIHNHAGVIDEDYRGELFVVLHNDRMSYEFQQYEDLIYHITAGDKITQLVVLPYVALHPYEVKELSETERGSNAFGSTGV